MLPSTNIKEGELKLRRVTELSIQFRDVIAPESRGDIQVAKDFASAIREEYDAVLQGNPIFNMGGRMILAKQYNRAAGKALDRTKHITDMASRNVQRGLNVPCRSDGPPVVIVEGPRTVNSDPEEANNITHTGQSSAERSSNSVSDGEECDHDAEGERSHPAVSDEQAARYECVELKICSCDNTQFVEMKLQNMSNPELSVEADRIRFGRASHHRARSP